MSCMNLTRISEQQSHTTKAPGSGTGLGLNISHHIIVNKHGGTIEVRSQPGSTCFEV